MIKNTFYSVGKRAINRVTNDLRNTEKQIASDLIQEIKSRAHMPEEFTHLPQEMYYYPNIANFNVYNASWKYDEEHRTVINDYVVYWKKIDGPIAFGKFIEWGTGTLGEQNGNPLNYPYTLKPWDMATKYQNRYGTLTPYNADNENIPVTSQFLFGSRAIPHIHPSVDYINAKYTQLIKEKYGQN